MDSEPQTQRTLEKLPQRIILASRWILVVFYAVLTISLAAFAAAFVVHFVELAPQLFSMHETELILAVLGLVDATLVASLVVMVIISGYDNFIGTISAEDQALPWLGNLDASALKIKIAASIVAISSIELLEVFLNADHYTTGRIAAAVVLQLTFVISAVGLGILARLTRAD